MSTKDKRIGFIGGGNMAFSLAGGLVADGCKGADILVSEPSEAKREHLARQLGVSVFEDNTEVVSRADIVVLAVKPQQAEAALTPLAEPLAQRGCPLLSIAAGVPLARLASWVGSSVPIIRAMPNTPALVRSGVTALLANEQVTEAHRDLAESVMRAVGTTLWVEDEADLDTVTAISGSGPAYFFAMMEALEEAAVAHGLAPDAARLLVAETAFGAAKLALESDETPAELRRRVTSPGGTTAAGVGVLDQADFQGLMARVVEAARNRARELAEEL